MTIRKKKEETIEEDALEILYDVGWELYLRPDCTRAQFETTVEAIEDDELRSTLTAMMEMLWQRDQVDLDNSMKIRELYLQLWVQEEPDEKPEILQVQEKIQDTIVTVDLYFDIMNPDEDIYWGWEREVDEDLTPISLDFDTVSRWFREGYTACAEHYLVSGYNLVSFEMLGRTYDGKEMTDMRHWRYAFIRNGDTQIRGELGVVR
jgi:hypothetical protein